LRASTIVKKLSRIKRVSPFHFPRAHTVSSSYIPTVKAPLHRHICHCSKHFLEHP